MHSRTTRQFWRLFAGLPLDAQRDAKRAYRLFVSSVDLILEDVCGVLGIARRNGAYYSIVMQTISLKLPDDLLAQLESEAKARRVTKSSLVRESIEKSFRGQAQAGAVSCYDLARDLVGTVKGLPEDLADNPKYMEGFGQ